MTAIRHLIGCTTILRLITIVCLSAVIQGCPLDDDNFDGDDHKHNDVAYQSTDGAGENSAARVLASADGQYRGIPDPSAALGYNIRGDYAVTKRVTGSHGKKTLSCEGTAAEPCVIDASEAEFENLKVEGRYVIFQGGTVKAGPGRGPWLNSACERCVMRDVTLIGPKADSGHSSAVRLSDMNVWLGGRISGFGDNRPDAREQDFHGIKVMRADVWILEAEIFDVSGDSVQVGDASRGSAERVYIGGGYFHDNRENAVDIKDSKDVVVSGLRMSGFARTESSSGEALIIHDDAFDARIYDNTISDTFMGIVSSGKSGHIIENNTISATHVGIQIRSTRNLTVRDNTIDAPRRVHINGGGVTGSIQR